MTFSCINLCQIWSHWLRSAISTYWALQSNFFLYNLVYKQFLRQNWLSWLHSTNVSIDHLCCRASFVLLAIIWHIFFLHNHYIKLDFLNQKECTPSFAIKFLLFFWMKFYRILFIPSFYVKIDFPDYKVLSMYQFLSLNFFNFTQLK